MVNVFNNLNKNSSQIKFQIFHIEVQFQFVKEINLMLIKHLQKDIPYIIYFLVNVQINNNDILYMYSVHIILYYTLVIDNCSIRNIYV